MENQLIYFNIIIISFGAALLFAIFFFIKSTRSIIIAKKQELLFTEKKALKSIIINRENLLSEISKELHDNLGSRIYGLKLITRGDELQFFADCPSHIVAWNKLIANEIEKLDLDVRKLAHEYAPYIQDVKGLQNALMNFIHQSSIKNYLECSLILEEKSNLLIENELALEIYRIITDLIKNIISFSEASNASICICTINSIVRIKVEDNGVEFFKATQKKELGIGIRNIQTRVQLSGGSVKFTNNTNGNGTCVLIEMPLIPK